MLSIGEIKNFLNEDMMSQQKRLARKGIAYYEAEHDIKQYKVYYIDSDGTLQEDKFKSNERISHPFFTELVDQCVQHMLSGDESIVKSDVPELQKMLDEYFDDEFKMELNDLLTYTSVEGFSFLYRYKDENLKSRFKFADGLNVVEVPAKYTKDGKSYVIYKYYWKTVKNKRIDKVEVWDDTQVSYYVLIDGTTLKKDEDNPKPRYHVLYEEDGHKYYDTFGEVPFIRLDNNRKQLSDLHVVKQLIDDYDLMSCGLSNNIQDMAEGYFVIKGFQGSNIDELTQAIRAKKQVGVDEDGSVDIKTVNIPYEARKVKLELDEKNIYRFGMGFDSSKAETSNVTNVVIKSRYTLLDMKANKKEMQLRRMMKKLIKIVLDEINADKKTAYTPKDVWVEFKRVTPSNEKDNATIKQTEANTRQIEINTLLNIASHLDNETLLKRICEVLDIDYETVKDNLPEDVDVSLADAQDELNKTEQGSMYKIKSIMNDFKRGNVSRTQALKLFSDIGVSEEDAQAYLADE